MALPQTHDVIESARQRASENRDILIALKKYDTAVAKAAKATDTYQCKNVEYHTNQLDRAERVLYEVTTGIKLKE